MTTSISRRALLLLMGASGVSIHFADWSAPEAGLHNKAPHHAPSHGLLTRFVRKIRTSGDDERRIKDRRRLVRHAVEGHLKKARLRLARSPNSGSYAKRTGTIRYNRGNSRIGGQDIDLPFVLTAHCGQDLDLHALLDLFHGFVLRSYPRSTVSRTKSSIRLELKSFSYGVDIVPMVAHPERKDLEYLYRADGTKRLTSISGHVKFVKSRTTASKKLPGIVAFNDMVRLFKWWREIRVCGDQIISEVPTFLLELLCAAVFDEHAVATTYTKTLDTWFQAMAAIVESRREIRFPKTEVFSSVLPCSQLWLVRDPINPENLAVPEYWSEVHINRLGSWLREGIEVMARVREHDRRDDGKGALAQLEQLFGPAIRNLAA